MSAVYRSPEQLLLDLDIGQPEDIDVEVIAYECEATVTYEPLSGCEAHIMGYNNKAIITVNANSPRPRQRFSAAHELGHWMRDRDTVAFSCDERKIRHDSDALRWRENPEHLANHYAADLILPEGMFGSLAKDQDITFETVERLAGRFQASLMATSIRLVRLGSFPSLVVWRTVPGSEGRDWAIPDPDVPFRKLGLRETPTANSISHDLLEGEQGPTKPMDVYADAWFEHERADRFSVREDSRRIRDGVLTLLWWKDECQLLELNEDE